MLTRTVTWKLYKPSGKWAYGGTAEIPSKHYWDDNKLLADIEANQTEVIVNTITEGYYFVTIDGDEGNPNHNHPFVSRLVLPFCKE